MDSILSSKTKSNSIHQGPDKITYTWSEVNGYATTNNGRTWNNLFYRKKPIEQKHILKDGNCFSSHN